jgi:uncharacterized protein (DUF4213/DUF364 family)
MSNTNLIEAWIGDLHRVLERTSVIVSDVRIGVFYTAAQLSNSYTGVAFTPRGLTDTVCCPKSASVAPPAGRLAGQDAWDLANYALASVPLRRAVGVAVLNALSAMALAQHGVPGGRLVPSMDALEAAAVCAEDRVAMVGGFLPFIKALKSRVQAMWVVDKHPEALKEDELPFWRAPEQAAETLAQASVVLITGSSLVEGGIDELLQSARKARRIILAGPTASPWAPPFFERGVDVLGGIRVLDGPKMLQVVAEGGSGYFFKDGAEKVCILKDRG